MSQTNALPSVEAMAAGLVVAAASTGPVERVLSAVNHGGLSFVHHNPDMAPVFAGATAVLGNLAATHGLGPVWAMLNALLPFIAGLDGQASVLVAPAPAPTA